MKKIRLDLECVEVESFPTNAVPTEVGTVEAHLRSRPGDTFCGDCTLNSCYCEQTRYC